MTTPLVNFSPFAGAGAQFFDSNGVPLAGGLLYTYQAGSTTQQATYTTSSATVQNSNPIVLGSDGRTPQEIWLLNGYSYKFVLQNASGSTIGTYDNIPYNSSNAAIINDASSIAFEQGTSTTAGSFLVGGLYLITYIGTTDFTSIGATSNTVGTYFTATGVGSGTGTAQISRTVQSKLQDIVSVYDFMSATQITAVQSGNSGNVDCTSAIQSFFTYICNQTTNKQQLGFFPPGTYYCTSTINVSSGFYLPNLLTAGKDSVIIKSTASPIFYIQGGSGNFSNAEWQGMTLNGITNNASNEAVRVDGLGWWEWKNLVCKNVYNGVRLYNLTSGNFTEGCRFPYLNCNTDVTVAMRLSVGSGTNSFRSSGMPRAAINIPSGGTALLVDSGAHPYFFDLDQFTCWPFGTSATVITNNSTQQGNTFIGNITLEGAGSGSTVKLFGGSSTTNNAWIGNLISLGEQLGTNNLSIGSNISRALDTIVQSNGAEGVGGMMQSYLHNLTTTGESVVLTGSGNQQGYLLAVRMDATNWYYSYLFMVTPTGYGGAPGFTQLAVPLSFNSSGWGSPTFSASSSNQYAISVTNSNWGAGTVVQWSIIPFGMIPALV